MNQFVPVEQTVASATAQIPSIAPAAPASAAETGLDIGFLIDLMVKTIYRTGAERPSAVARHMCLPVGVVTELIEEAVDKKLMETLGQLGASLTAEMRYGLTGKGRAWTHEALAQSEYFGPAPVTLQSFSDQLRRQSIRNETLTRKVLDRAFKELTLDQKLIEKLGPAANCGAAVLLYGPPGNGKSSIAEAICDAFGGEVFFPHCVVVDKQIISVYDPTMHHPIMDGDDSDGTLVLRRESASDKRFVRCKRPAVITGGELTLDRLDLALNTVSRVYEAPLQLKAAGGVFVVDDFGRQRQSPQELINRLIIPLEKGLDYLSLETGRKFDIPFDALVVFSTNIPPKQLVDEAALRRLRYKILVDRPDAKIMSTIFQRTAGSFGLDLTEELERFIFDELYARTEDALFAGFHPRFLMDQMVSISAFEGLSPRIRRDFLARAWANLFTEE